MLPLRELTTTDGYAVEVIDPGLHNRHAGPDFFNAKVRINGTLWVGNVEIHEKSTDWYAHGHDRDSAYDNVVLHVVGNADVNVKNSRGDYLPQMVLEVPSAVKEHYEELLHTDQYPPCYSIIPNLSRLLVHSWMAALQTVGRLDKVLVYGVDGVPETKEMIAGGHMMATAGQSPRALGRNAAEQAYKILAGEQVPKLMRLPTQLITKENLGTDMRGWD